MWTWHQLRLLEVDQIVFLKSFLMGVVEVGFQGFGAGYFVPSLNPMIWSIFPHLVVTTLGHLDLLPC